MSRQFSKGIWYDHIGFDRPPAGAERFESVYLRPTNGRKRNPPSPRDLHAIQYFAYPEWSFDRLARSTRTGGTGADIGPDEWIHLRLEVEPRRVIPSVNGHATLVVNERKIAAITGAVGLFVDIGAEADGRT